MVFKLIKRSTQRRQANKEELHQMEIQPKIHQTSSKVKEMHRSPL